MYTFLPAINILIFKTNSLLSNTFLMKAQQVCIAEAKRNNNTKTIGNDDA